MKKYQWTTYKVIQETENAVTIFFNTGFEKVNYQPGQYLNITCEIDGEQISRSYSFSSVPSEEYPSITVKRVHGGKMSNHLVEKAKQIKEWQIEAPFGNFILDTQIAEQSEIIFLAGGSGISPLFSMLKTINQNPNTPLLLYSSKSLEETIFRKELDEIYSGGRLNYYYSLTSDSSGFVQIRHIPGRFSPIVIQSVIRKQIKDISNANYYICGPEALMQLYREVLSSMNIPKEQIHMEYFDASPENKPFEHDGISREVLINYFQDQFFDEDEVRTFECTRLIEVKAGQTLLEALNENDIDVPSSCNSGTCGSCWATKTSGAIQMQNNYALTKEQVSQGTILLCQSYPLDETVSIRVE